MTAGLLDFFLYGTLDKPYRAKYLSGSKKSAFFSTIGREVMEWYRKPYVNAIKKSKRFDNVDTIQTVARGASRFLDLGNQAGEGWYLTGDMVDLIEKGCKRIICLQPFGCMPNHLTGKGMIRPLMEAYPDVQISAIDYDASASAVNQMNRLKLLLATMFE